MSDILPKMTSGLLVYMYVHSALWNLFVTTLITTHRAVGFFLSQRWKLSYQSSFDKKVSCRKLFLFLCTWIYGLRKLPLFLSQECLFYKLFNCLRITFSNKCKLTTWCCNCNRIFLTQIYHWYLFDISQSRSTWNSTSHSTCYTGINTCQLCWFISLWEKQYSVF